MNTALASFGFGLITASILAIAAVGFTLQFGITNLLNLAYGDIMTAAAFAAYLVRNEGASIWLALLAGGAFGAVFSLLLNRLLYVPFIHRGLRLFGMIIVTLAASIIIQNGLQAIFRSDFFSLDAPAGRTYHLAGMLLTRSQLIIIGIAILAMAAVHALLRFTDVGKAMRATSANAELARSCGIQTERVVDTAWLLSGALCGIAGVALMINLATFTSATGGTFLIPIIAAAVLGGVGHPYGAMLGALVIGISSEMTATVINPAYKQVVAFAILAAVLIVRPQGILSEIASNKEVTT